MKKIIIQFLLVLTLISCDLVEPENKIRLYKVSFNANGGSGNIESISVSEGSFFTIPVNKMSRHKYTFSGWNTSSVGLGETYSDGATITMGNSDLVLYAQWSKIVDTYTIKFDPNGGTGNMDDQIIPYNSKKELNTNSYIRNEYSFFAWNTNPDGSGTFYSDKSETPNNAMDITLYAQWSKSFITKWRISNKILRLPLSQFGSVYIIINWGDGSTELINSSNYKIDHEYSVDGDYTVTIDGFCKVFGYGQSNKASTDTGSLLDVISWGTIGLHNEGGHFSNCDQLTTFSASDTPDLTGVTNFSFMFAHTDLFNDDLSNWDTSNVTNMSGMFYYAKIFNQNLSNLDTSNVTDMSNMFAEATNFNQNVSNFDTSKVTNMSNMFAYATNFNQSVSSFDTSKVTNMSAMFSGAKNFNQSISDFKTSNVTDMSNMFSYATNFNQSVSSFDTSKVTNMSAMFSGAKNFNQSISDFKTSNVTDMSNMFSYATNFNQSVSSLDTSNVTNMSAMFSSAKNFNQSISDFKTSNVTDMSAMFDHANNFNQSVSNFDTSNVTNMLAMFAQATNFNQSISNFDTSNVTNMSAMFSGAKNFNQSISDFKTSNVTDMSNMFSYATNFNQSVSNFDTSNVTDMSNMFSYATNFNQSITNFKTSNVTDMSNMYCNATNFNQDISMLNYSKVNSFELKNTSYSFLGGSGLSKLNYDKLLISLSNQTLQQSIEFSAGYIKYSSTATTARQKIIDDFCWIINDGGQDI